MTALAFALALVGMAQGNMILTGANIPSTDAATSDYALRGHFVKGDVWGPPVAGSNQLDCGLLNDPHEDIVADRPKIAAGEAIKIHGSILDTKAGGELIFEIKYGPSPSFHSGAGGWILGDQHFVDESAEEVNWQLTRTLPEDAYNSPATIQVEYVQLLKNGTKVHFFQCVDIEITNGKALPDGVGPDGLGNPARLPKDRDGGFLDNGPPVAEGGLSDFNIVVIVLFILIVLAMIVWYMKYRADQIKLEDQDKNAQFEPQLEDDEQNQPPMEPSQEKEPEPPVPSKSESEPEPEPSSDGEDVPSDGDAAGSKGRHFHFRYVE